MDFSTLSPQQKQIVKTLNSPLFVEAGAGSGKTFTLTKRVVWALSAGSDGESKAFLDDLSQVLVITFTNAAAREIKERVRQALRDAGPELSPFALQVDSAWISTIHGMCSRILKRHALDLGLDPGFRVATENEHDELYKIALDDVVGAAQREANSNPANNPQLAKAFELFGYGSETKQGYTGVLGLVDKIIGRSKSTPGGFDELRIAPAPDVEGSMDTLLRACEALWTHSKDLGKAGGPQITKACDDLREFFSFAPGQRTAQAASALLKDLTLPRSSKKLKEMLDDAKAAKAEAQLESALGISQALTGAVVDLARRVDDEYSLLKRQQSVLDNDDLIQLALHAVKDNEAVARDYAGRFRLVMVDEFQDTDTMQLELIKILSGPGALHLTTVGDAQQSIYRFRGADVGVFRSRGRELPPENRVQMGKNFRSHADVLSMVDAVCDDKHGGVVRDFMHLEPDLSGRRKDKYHAPGLPRINVELVWGNGSGADYRSAVTAAAIAERLSDFAAAGQDPGDMVLLLGATTKAQMYIDALRSRGLECVVSGGSTFTKAEETQVMASLLHTLANWNDTQSGLFPLLSSPMFDLGANDLVMLGTKAQDRLDAPTKRQINDGLDSLDLYDSMQASPKLRRAHDVLVRARESLATRPVADVCAQVVLESGWLGRLEQQGAQGKAVEANVLAAIDYIRDLTDELGLGPARAAAEFDLWLAKSKIAPARLSGGNASAVEIMTVHASKGLEFPIVAVAECWKVPNGSSGVFTGRCDDGSSMVLLGAPPSDSKNRIMPASAAIDQLEVSDNPSTLAEWYTALRNRNQQEEQEEKTRLLYVALTRAREALVVGLTLGLNKSGKADAALGDAVLQNLFDGSVPPTGEGTFNYHKVSYPDQDPSINPDAVKLGPPQRGYVRCIQVASAKPGVEVDSGATLQMGDGYHEESAEQLAALRAGSGAVGRGDAEAKLGGGSTMHEGEGADVPFVLYKNEPDQFTPAVSLWRPREGVYSYSSAHAQMANDFAAKAAKNATPMFAAMSIDAESPAADAGLTAAVGPRPVTPAIPTRVEREAEQEGSPVVEDSDKATSLGSAFHELAQGMVETGRFPDEDRIGRSCAYWNLRPRTAARLRAALERWRNSDLRAEALTYKRVRAEVPFFSPAKSQYGSYVEGAIDLLATNPSDDHAFLVDYKTGDLGLSPAQIQERHRMQANFYARVLMDQGYKSVSCNFVCVETHDPTGQPFVARYDFDQDMQPVL